MSGLAWGTTRYRLFQKELVFTKVVVKKSKEYKRWAEMGPRGSVWADTQPKSIPMHLGSLWKPSWALGKPFLTKNDKNRQQRRNRKVIGFNAAPNLTKKVPIEIPHKMNKTHMTNSRSYLSRNVCIAWPRKRLGWEACGTWSGESMYHIAKGKLQMGLTSLLWVPSVPICTCIDLSRP